MIAPSAINAEEAQEITASANPTNVVKSQATYRFDEVLSLLSSLHISQSTKDELLEAALQGMIESLDDPYTVYYAPQRAIEFQNAVNGQGIGLGITLATNDKGTYLSQVFPGTPAEQAGLHSGDYLVAVNGESGTVSSEQALNKALSGKKEGDTIEFTILRGTDKQTITIAFQRIQYPILSYHLVGGNMGYIRLYTFALNTEVEFTKALEDLKAQGMTSLLIDLRDNGGGYVESARKLAEHFIERGTFMYERKQGKAELRALEIKEGHSFKQPVAVLINEHAASASEMFAGFMQDYKLATIIGTKSYGKGVAQQVIPLISGGTLKVTDMEWLTPDQHGVNETGIKPDIEVSGGIEPVIRAMLTLHVPQLDLKLTDTLTYVNQIEWPVNVPFKQIAGSYYVPARLLAALAEGAIRWDGSRSEVSITSKSMAISYAVSTGPTGDAFVMNGTSWIRLEAFQKQLAGLTWAADEYGLQLHLKKEEE